MRTFLLLLLTVSFALGQSKPQQPINLSKKDQSEIRELARKQLENLRSLFNTITFIDASDYEINTVIKNSFLPNANQLFRGDDVIIEDDIDPQHIGIGEPVDLTIETYLRNLNLFYAKTDAFSIDFSNVIARLEVASGRPIVKVFFTSTFKSKHNQIDKPYQPTQRVAEFQVERVNNKSWSVMITRLGFTKVDLMDVSSTSLKDNDVEHLRKEIVKHKRLGWIMILGGVASLAGGYFTYNHLQKGYQTYTQKVDALNLQFNQWQELSRQPVGSQMTPIGFNTYAGKDAYVMYGAGTTGLGLSLVGIRHLIKARREIKALRNSEQFLNDQPTQALKEVQKPVEVMQLQQQPPTSTSVTTQQAKNPSLANNTPKQIKERSFIVPKQFILQSTGLKATVGSIGVGAGIYAFLLRRQYTSKLNTFNEISKSTDPDGDGIILNQIDYSKWQNAYDEVEAAQRKKGFFTACLGIAAVAAVTEAFLLVYKPKTGYKGFSLKPTHKGVGLALRYTY